MNNFAKALVLALIFATPVAISAPAVQAGTIHPTKIKTVKVHQKHYKHHKHHPVHKAHK
ncbi:MULTISPECIES: hypothetical protein [Nostoc]|uniref:Acid-shock protein n=1 Tax=Nostoc punctiforme FACHB-252 TaxID=1357509 RepID=A0ABR8HCC1_NOSPU|nr:MULTISPECIES: hypothetical protein [Nostoc]MBD2613088.1 hypothetical protein [Nostoc punctiforme FACHB-252]MDZ8011644.1 hypothetical protein [Nostoc sp. ZfuVER08]